MPRGFRIGPSAPSLLIPRDPQGVWGGGARRVGGIRNALEPTTHAACSWLTRQGRSAGVRCPDAPTSLSRAVPLPGALGPDRPAGACCLGPGGPRHEVTGSAPPELVFPLLLPGIPAEG
jgi:hypothetical protein